MEKDGCSNEAIATAKWVVGHFEHYCETQHATEIEMPLIAQFLKECFGIDLHANQNSNYKNALRRPLLILMDWHKNGNYRKRHAPGSGKKEPAAFEGACKRLCDFISSMDRSDSTKKTKLWAATSFLAYLDRNGKTDLLGVSANDAHKYLASLDNLARSTKAVLARVLRELLNWMHAQGMVSFSGAEAFPRIQKAERSGIISYYSKDEIRKVLNCVDTGANAGKAAYFVIAACAFLGIRAGDLANLRLGDIDWENSLISMVQQKTGRPATWPLIDEVKFPLLDYLKHARHESGGAGHVLVTLTRPHTKYASGAPLYRMVASHIKKAGLDTEGRRKGPHSLRHSLATGLMNDGVPLSTISGILGHASTQSTESYLSVDEAHLKELSLEVPNVL
jgi:integrase